MNTNNGWSIDPPTRRFYIGHDKDGCEVRTGPTGDILEFVAWAYNKYVDTITTASGHRSWAVNKASGGITTSNHLSATAEDLDGFKHPYEATRPWYRRFTGYRNGFSTGQVLAIRTILATCEGSVKWGEDFARGYRDGMHFEIAKGYSYTQLSVIAAKLRTLMAGEVIVRPVIPVVIVPPIVQPKDYDMPGFVVALFAAYVGREASAYDVIYWCGKSDREDLSYTQLERIFTNSPCERGTISSAYSSILKRIASPAEIDSWLARKLSIRGAFEAIRKSPEAAK